MEEGAIKIKGYVLTFIQTREGVVDDFHLHSGTGDVEDLAL